MGKRAIDDISTAGHRPRPRDVPSDRAVPALTIVAHPDAGRVGHTLLAGPLPPGREILISRVAPDFHPPGSALGAPLADVFLSRTPVRIRAGEGECIQVISGQGSTALALGGRPFREIELSREQVAAGVPIELADRIVLLLHLRPPGARPITDSMGMVGDSPQLCAVREAITAIVDLSVPVLVRGETGTGKELVARAVHRNSPRREGPFVSVNLGALPRELAAAELFGAQKGAFTGATRDRPGLFEAARGGTLFLDEVGEAPPEVQVMLLRVLESGEMSPVGGHAPMKTDVRLIAATDAHLEDLIRDGRFRAPLLHRLSGYLLRLPPLRDRREDIGPLFHHFAREDLAAVGQTHRLLPTDPYADAWMPVQLASLLVRYSWPGNIRELRNVTRQIVIDNRGRDRLRIDPRLAAEMEASALPLPEEPASLNTASAPLPARRRSTEVTEEELIAALREHRWDLKPAADALRIPRSSIYDLVARFPGVPTAGRLTAEDLARCHRECGGDLDAARARSPSASRSSGREARAK
ncbi:MAG: sigma-54 dependent transcriptional regulator [Polyangiaceae bacterium]